MSTSTAASAAHLDYVLRIADTSLILGQRLSEWCGHGPVIEEDIALTNVALDLIGQARLLLSHVGRLEGKGRDEDQLACNSAQVRSSPATRGSARDASWRTNSSRAMSTTTAVNAATSTTCCASPTRR